MTEELDFYFYVPSSVAHVLLSSGPTSEQEDKLLVIRYMHPRHDVKLPCFIAERQVLSEELRNEYKLPCQDQVCPKW